MPETFILTCEHAGNEIPPKYLPLFKGKEEVLVSHKAIDFGALRLAKHLALACKLPLFYNTTSRLLVEANRSLDSDSLFSEYSKNIPEKDRQKILDAYYFPHRTQVEEAIEKAVKAGKKVVHLAVHTFTPAMDGEVRKAEAGILFDPGRKFEKNVARRLKDALTASDPKLKVMYNSPYPGVTDGLATSLRKKFNDQEYAGFELEINQKFFLNGEPEVWEKTTETITKALKAVMPAKNRK